MTDEKQCCDLVRHLQEEQRLVKHAVMGDGVYIGHSGRLNYLEKEIKRMKNYDTEIRNMRRVVTFAVVTSIVSLTGTVIKVIWG